MSHEGQIQRKSSGMVGFRMPALARPLLYSFRRCPYAMRARLALQVSQTSCQLREVVLRDKPQCMLSASKKGTVPVLITGTGTGTGEGNVIDESLDIMLWCLGRDDPEGWLGQDEKLSEALKLIDRNDGDFKDHLDRYKYADRYSGEDPDLDHRELASAFLRELDSRLCKSPWLLGAKISLADAALAPFVRQFANTDRAWFDVQPWPALSAWLHDFLASPLFASIMTKYPQWRHSDEPTLFPHTETQSWRRS